MKSVALALLALSAALAAAEPTLAQPYGGYGPPVRAGHGRVWNIDHRIEWVQERINRSRDSGALDRREYRRVQSRLDGIRATERRLRERQGRLYPHDREMLTARLDRLCDDIRHMTHDQTWRRPW